MRSRSPVRFAVDKCLQADIPSVLNGSFVAIRPSLRMSGFGTEPNGSLCLGFLDTRQARKAV